MMISSFTVKGVSMSIYQTWYENRVGYWRECEN